MRTLFLSLLVICIHSKVIGQQVYVDRWNNGTVKEEGVLVDEQRDGLWKTYDEEGGSLPRIGTSMVGTLYPIS